MEKQTENAEATDDEVAPGRRYEVIDSKPDAHRDEHDEGEEVQLLVATLIVEERTCEEVHAAAEQAGSHKGQYKDAAAEEQRTKPRPRRHPHPYNTGEDE